MQHEEREALRARVGCARSRGWISAAMLAVLGTVGTVLGPAAFAQSEAGKSTWTFTVDSANNLVIQDLEAFSTAQVSGMRLCLRYYPSCPSASDRRASDLRVAKPRYILRGNGGFGDWRIEPSQPTVRDTGAVMPFQVGGVEQGMVQLVSSPGDWTADLQRIPASELKVGDGKRWNVFLTFAAPPPASGEGCWIEMGCTAN